MDHKQTQTVEGSLLIVVVLLIVIWFAVSTWRPAVNLVVETVPTVQVDTLSNDSLKQLAELEQAGKTYGLPVQKPDTEQVGKSPLF